MQLMNLPFIGFKWGKDWKSFLLHSPTRVNISESMLALIFRSKGASLSPHATENKRNYLSGIKWEEHINSQDIFQYNFFVLVLNTDIINIRGKLGDFHTHR